MKTRSIDACRWAFVWLAACGLFAGAAPIGAQTPNQNASQEADSSDPPQEEALTEAGRLLRLENIVNLDREKLKQLEADYQTRSDLFDELASNLKDVEGQIDAKKQQIEEVDRSVDLEGAVLLDSELEQLLKRQSVLKNQSEITFQSAKTIQTQVESLKQKIIQEEQAKLQIIGGPVDTVIPETTEATTPQPATVTSETAPAIQVMPGVSIPAPSVQPTTGPPPPETAEQVEARREAEKLATEADVAEQQVLDFLDRKAALEEQIELEKDLLKTARESRDNLNEAITGGQEELRALIAGGAPKAELAKLQTDIEGVQVLASEARAEIDERRAYLDSLHSRLDDLHGEQLLLTQEAEAKRSEAELARKKSGWLESPLHPQNFLRWLKTRGPRMLLVIAVASVLLFLVRTPSRRIARTLVRQSRGSEATGTNRADTLALSFSSAATVVIVIAGTLLVLQEAGVDIKTVLGGAAILGVAFAFGAQNMMRDYFSGFMILIEDQFELGDLITISGITGRVEKVNMRTTMLRDIEGRVHFIPNGGIKAITNRTYVWGRAVLEVPIAYKESVDHVMDVLLEIGRELREDPEWGSSVTDEPVMLGVDKFTEYGVIIKFMVQTQPDRIFATRRELLRRVKNRFDELGIQISVPYRQIIRGPDPED